MRQRAVLGSAAIVIAAGLLMVVMACGPDFSPDVFVPASHPENPQRYAAGTLGVLRRSYWNAEKVVAYRYLNGGTLSAEEQKAYVGPTTSGLGMAQTPEQWSVMQEQQKKEEAAKPVNRWLVARKAFGAGAPESIGQEQTINVIANGTALQVPFLNCPDAAFQTAIDTLAARTRVWGGGSADLSAWVKGQDQVFGNCAAKGEMPAAVDASRSLLLRQDRAYQIAAAAFYGGRWDEAVKGFEAIGRDTASPWSRWGEYLAARAEIRKAAMSAKEGEWGEQALFEPALLTEAAQRLGKVVHGSTDAEVRSAAERELGFVRIRLEPKKVLDEIAVALGGPKSDPRFAQHLADLGFLRDHGQDGDADLVRWMDAQRDNRTDASKSDIAAVDARAEWTRSQTLPWLVAALQVAKRSEGVLMERAAKVPQSSPAFVTVGFHRTRLLLADGRLPEARELSTTMLGVTERQGEAAGSNAFHGLRMRTATRMEELLVDAPRKLLETNSEAAGEGTCGDSPGERSTTACVKKLPELQVDADGAGVFNEQMPLPRWVEAARSTVLPENLREAVAWAAWVRAVELGNVEVTGQMAGLLPAHVRSVAGQGTEFAATFALLQNPGLRPYLQAGVQRSVSYDSLSNYRDNWWCDNVLTAASDDAGEGIVPRAGPARFLSDAERAEGAKEGKALAALPGGVVWMGRRAIDFLKSHPEEKDGAEALALVVRATHYGCVNNKDESAKKAVSKEAFDLLHERYPRSEWAARTKYYY